MKIIAYKNDQLYSEGNLFDPITGLSLITSDFFIGRSLLCQMPLEDWSISRKHARIFFDSNQNKYVIEKLASIGSLKVQNQEVSKATLNSGDIINIGPFSVHVMGIQLPQNFARSNFVDNDVTQDVKEEQGDQSEQEEQENLPQELHQEEISEFNPNEENSELEQMQEMQEFQEDPMEASIGEKTNEYESFAKYSFKITGPYAPYDKYELVEQQTYIGRDKTKCQIVLKDPDVSTQHALIKKQAARVIIKDLGSSNGTIVNGERINEKELGPQDEVLIGSTSFTLSVISEQIAQESSRLMPVASNQEIEIEEIVEEEMDFSKDSEITDENNPQNSGSGFPKNTAKAGIASYLKDPAKRKTIIYGLVGITLLAVLMLPDEQVQQGEAKKENDVAIKKDAKSSPGGTESQESQDSKAANAKKMNTRIFTPEERETMEVAYNTAKAYFYEGKLAQAERELDTIFALNPSGDYKQTLQIKREIVAANKEIAVLKEKKRLEELEAKKDIEIKALLEKATQAVKENQMDLAKGLMNQILERDPERPEVVGLKMEIDSIEKEKERKAIEDAQAKAERERKVALLAPGKNAYLKKEWYKANARLEEFLKTTNMDEDLIVEATQMLEVSKKELTSAVNPYLEKAESAFNGNDLLESYNNYKEVLEYDPTNTVALNKIDAINSILENRAKKIYREALIAESLSMFSQAWEKYQEVKEVSPKNSDYYNKASEKLKNFFGEEK